MAGLSTSERGLSASQVEEKRREFGPNTVSLNKRGASSRALHRFVGELSSATELGEVRHRLIDLLTAAMESAVPDAKARMIQLEARQAVSTALGETASADALATLNLIPLSILVAPGARHIVLAQDREASVALEAEAEVAAALASRMPFDKTGYQIIVRSYSAFQQDRVLYDCIAFKLRGAHKASG
jgi:hypothetical protein